MTQNQIKYQELEESRYHNRIMEQETKRSNLANEALKAETNAINDAHYMRSDAETQRSNKAREAETVRSNLAQEAELSRHNKTTETIQWFTANSEAKLRESNIKLNSVLEDKYYWDSEKARAEKYLTDAKTATEEDYYRPNLWANTQLTQANTLLSERKADTELYNHDVALTNAALNYNELQWYGTNKKLSVLQWAGNQITDLAKSAISFGGSVIGANQKLQSDMMRQGQYTPRYNYSIE